MRTKDVLIINKNLLSFSTQDILWFIVCLSSSFDIVLNLQIGGFSFRFVYVIILISCLVYTIQAAYQGKFIVRFLSIWPFLIWVSFLIVFIPNTPLWERNVGYILWLIIHFLYIIVTSNNCDTRDTLVKFVQLYLTAYLLISFLGLTQFTLGILGIDFFVKQWWIEGRFPRLNGFSYEPSYYATYLIIGFSTSYYLFRKQVYIFGQLPKYTSLFTFLAIILSTSRMGLLVVLAEILFFEVLINKGNILARTVILSCLGLLVGLVCIIAVKTDLLFFLFEGLGIMGSSAHSSNERLDGFFTQLEIFQRNPFKGYSLGGVSQAIAFEKGVSTLSQETIKPYDVSINVFVEVLTASGIIGFLFFMFYLYQLIRKTFKTNFLNQDKEITKVVNSLCWGLLFELLILCFNQTILRPYLWIHIALVNAAYFAQSRSSIKLSTK
jgi:O-antigen ligase